MTEYPLIVNILNPSKSYYAPECRNCGLKQCKNCPMPVSGQKTLDEFLAVMVHKQKFQDNSRLFINKDQLQDEKDTDDEEHSNNGYFGNSIKNSSMKQYGYGINDDDDNDNDDNGNAYNPYGGSSIKKKNDNAGRHKTFVLELIFVNRVIRQQAQTISGKLLSFDHHPREEKQTSSAVSAKARLSKQYNQTLKDCLEYFRQTEKLEKDNSWYCNVCKDHVEATKKIELYSVPPIMIMCLQRFKSHNIYFKEKLEDRIIFPIDDLDMSPYVLSQELKANHNLHYQLYAVSNHYGSLAFGHYTAYAQNSENGKWYDFNDSSVSELQSPDEVVSSAAYVLYYIRKDFFPDMNINYDVIKQSLELSDSAIA